jgi:hypothetical protein
MKYYLQKKKYAETNNQTSLFTVTASYFEIYNEKVYDLLELKDRDLEIRQDANKNIIISNLTEVLFFFFFFFTKHNNSCESVVLRQYLLMSNNNPTQFNEQIPISSYAQFAELYERGCQNRSTASTKLNSQSSRSHAIVTLKV